jgi:DNA-binding MarR family transcriptional regulator
MSRTSEPIQDELAQDLVDGFAEFSRRLRALKLPAGMTRERLGILSLIDEHGPIAVSELASLAKVRPPTMSRMTSSLVEDGLAKKQGNKADGRGVLIALTANGRRALKNANRLSVEHLKQALGKLSKSQVSALAGLARAMDDASDDVIV